MRVVAAVALLVLIGLAVGASDPPDARACTGRVVGFDEALRMSEGSVYAGRVRQVEPAGIEAVNAVIDVQLVVRGAGSGTIERLASAVSCEPILVGDWGYVVRDVRDPQYPGAPDDLFFAIGTSIARPILRAAGLPDTSTSTATDARPQAAPIDAVALLVAATLTGYAVMDRRLRSRPTPARPAVDTGRSTGPRHPSRS